MDLSSLQKSISDQGKHPPVDKWNPDFCGDIDLRIKQDGSWYYMGTPIGRHTLVKLFSSVIKKEDDDYYLVTPVEKVGIKVADVPFVVTQWREKDGFILFTTSVGDEVVASSDNPVTLQFNEQQEDYLPYVLIRRNLWARLHQNIFYQLVEFGEEAISPNQRRILQVRSGDYCFSLGDLE